MERRGVQWLQRLGINLLGSLIILRGLAALLTGHAFRRDVMIEGPLAYGFGLCAIIGGGYVLWAAWRPR